jgi:hypothetical protein
MNKEPIYPKDNGSLERARQSFYKKVREWRWEDPIEKELKPRGRKAKQTERIESKPRSESERLAFKNKFIK